MTKIDGLPSRYEPKCSLGRGGFGEVFEVFDSNLKKTLALKILSDGAGTPEETIRKEFEVLSNLQHANLVKVIDFGIILPKTPYFTMELIEGSDLRDFLRNGTNLGAIHAIIRQALSALSYLHKNGVLHGDIKPENIMIVSTDSGPPVSKFLDFGLTSTVGTKRKRLSGTPRFLAPEILSLGSAYSPSTDLYALGMSLIESVLQESVPLANSIDEDFLQNTRSSLTSRFFNQAIKNPSSLSSFILDLCKTNPDDRIHDAEAALHVFETITSDLRPPQEIHIDNLFIDRIEEMNKIDSFLQVDGLDKKVLIIRGPRGIGKKTVIRKAVQLGELKGNRIIDLSGSFPSYFSVDKFVETICACLSAPQKKRFMSSCSFVLSPQTSDKTKTNNKPNINRSLIIYDRLIQSLHQISQLQPILMVIPDIDGYGEDFIRLIMQLVKQIDILNSEIRLIVTLNSDASSLARTSAVCTKFASPLLTTTLDVRPFDDRALGSLLRETFGQELLSQKERQILLSQAHGIPLVIVAFIKHLISSNVIQFEDGSWLFERKSYGQSHIPTDIDSTFAIAEKDVTHNERMLLQLFAVYGQAVTPKEVSTFASRHIDNHENALASLLDRMILQYDVDGTVSFGHPLYTEYIMKHLSKRILKKWSLIIAEHLESKTPNDSFRIAQHYLAAEAVDQAVAFGLNAVNQVYSTYLLYDCLKLLLSLKELALKNGTKQQLMDILAKLAPIETQTGLPKQALDDYYELCDYVEDDVEKASYLRRIAMIYQDLLGNINKSRSALKKALRIARTSGNTDLVAQIYFGLAGLGHRSSVYYYERAASLSKHSNINLYSMSLAHLAYKYKLRGALRKAHEAEQVLDKNINKCNHAAKKEVLLYLSHLYFFKGDYAKAKRYIMKKIRLEKRAEDSLSMISSMSSLAAYYYIEGSYYNVIRILREACSISRRYDHHYSSITILSNLSLAYRDLADYGHSISTLKMADDIIEENIDEVNSAFLIKKAMLYLLLGTATEKKYQQYAKEALRKSLATKNSISTGHYNMSCCHYYQNNLRYTNALRYANESLALFKRAEDRDDIVSALVNTATIAIVLGRLKDASSDIRKANDIYEEIHCEYLKPLLMLGRAMLARATDAEDAKSTFTEALRASKKIGTREITWQIQREYALYFKDRGELHKALAYYKDTVETIKQITESIDEEELKTSYLEVPFRKRVFDEIKEIKRQITKTE